MTPTLSVSTMKWWWRGAMYMSACPQVDVLENVKRIRERVAEAAIRAGRSPDEIEIMAVTKTVEPERINEAVEAGLRLLQTRPEHINMKLLFNYPAYKEWIALSNRNSEPKRNSKQESECVIQTPDIIMEEEYKKLRNILAQDLLERILKKDPGFFEALVIKLLVAMGYGGSLNEAAGMVVGKSGDEGIDGIIKEDKLGLDNIYIQAKRWNNVVERPEVQKFVGALAGKGATKGIFITTSSFSRGAREFKPQNNIKIVLIDGNQLCEYMIDYNIGVFTANTFEVKRIDIDFFESEE